MTRRSLRATACALALVLPGCLHGLPESCTRTEAPDGWRIHMHVPRSALVDAEARPTVEARIVVGSRYSLSVIATDDAFCGVDPTVTWRLTDPASSV